MIFFLLFLFFFHQAHATEYPQINNSAWEIGEKLEYKLMFGAIPAGNSFFYVEASDPISKRDIEITPLAVEIVLTILLNNSRYFN